jgi:hypothetical protein
VPRTEPPQARITRRAMADLRLSFTATIVFIGRCGAPAHWPILV